MTVDELGNDIEMEAKYSNQWAYECRGRSVVGKHDGKLYWFSKWYTVCSPFLHYPPDLYNKLPRVPEEELFIQFMKAPDSVLIR